MGQSAENRIENAPATGESVETARYAALYDSQYFAEGCGIPYARTEHWLRFFDAIADRLIAEMNPQSVLDAGCALGLLVESLRDRGVDAYGVDISEYAIEQVREDLQPFCWVGSLTAPLPRRYDLIVCIEVLEHMPQDESERAIEQLCAATDDIIMSSSPFDYKEATHFNVQPPEYWAAHFARHGFVRDVDFDAGFITPWAVRFRRSGQPIHRVIADYERRLWPLLKENTDLRAELLELRARLNRQAQQMEAQAQEHDRLRVALYDDIRRLNESNWTLHRNLEPILNDPGWQLLQKLHGWRVRLAPPNSRREALFRRLMALLAR